MPMPAPIVISVNTSPGGVPKRPVASATVTQAGIEGDGHNHAKHNSPLQALSVIDTEDLDDLRRAGFDVHPGATGENLTCRGLSVDELAVGDRLRFSGGVVAELTKRRTTCYVLDAIDPRLKDVMTGRAGFYARVVRPGVLRGGETIEVAKAIGPRQDSEAPKRFTRIVTR